MVDSERILVKLIGGLGNQLFQLSAGLVFASFDSRNLCLDASSYNSNYRRPFELLKLFDFGEYGPKAIYQEDGGRRIILDFSMFADTFFDPRDFAFGSFECFPINLAGYFQNYDYVGQVLTLLRSALRLEHRPGKGDQIHQSDDTVHVGIHIRNGDYLWSSVRKVHGLVEVNDQFGALSDVIQGALKIGKSVAVELFSDDPRLNLQKSANPRVSIVPREVHRSSLEDFSAMMNKDILICPNSTYSYWAGTLSTRVQKLYLPEIWMKSNLVTTEKLLHERTCVYKNKLT